jgi:hypothetical protein
MATLTRKPVGRLGRRAQRAIAPAPIRRVPKLPLLPAERVAPEMLRARWRVAFDAAEAALQAGGWVLAPREVHRLTERLAAEREPTAQLLQAFARNQRVAVPFEHLPLPPRETAGFALVIGVGRGNQAETLHTAGADLVVSGLEELLVREGARPRE